MITTRVKPYDIGEMSVKWIEKKGNFEGLSSFENPVELKNEAIEAIKNGGKVYAVLEKKELKGIYLFKKETGFFAKEDEFVTIGDKKFDKEKFWYGDCTNAFVLTKKYLPAMDAETEKKLAKQIIDTVKLYIFEGSIAGVAFEDELYFRKNIADKKGTAKIAAGYALGFLLGLAIGICIFHEWWMGLCFGSCYMAIFGGASISKTRIDETGKFDLVKGVDKEIDKEE